MALIVTLPPEAIRILPPPVKTVPIVCVVPVVSRLSVMASDWKVEGGAPRELSELGDNSPVLTTHFANRDAELLLLTAKMPPED